MKAFFSSILVFSAIILSSFQNPVEIDNIITAVKKGNAAQLSLNFDQKVMVIVPGVDKSYSAQQSSLIMQKFLATYKVTDFIVSKIGKTSTGYFITGSLQTKTDTFGTSITTIKVSGSERINAISFF